MSAPVLTAPRSSMAWLRNCPYNPPESKLTRKIITAPGFVLRPKWVRIRGRFQELHQHSAMSRFKVTISGSGTRFEVRSGESVLNAALRQGVMLPYSCKNGTCGSCKGRIESGEVHYPFHPPLALERSDFAGGYTLLCQAEPLEDLVIQAREIEAIKDIPLCRMPARVIHKSRLAENVIKLQLKLPRAQQWTAHKI